MIKMPIKDQATSMGMIAGWFMFGLGAYVIVATGNVIGGLEISGLGLGILGIRNKLNA